MSHLAGLARIVTQDRASQSRRCPLKSSYPPAGAGCDSWPCVVALKPRAGRDIEGVAGVSSSCISEAVEVIVSKQSYNLSFSLLGVLVCPPCANDKGGPRCRLLNVGVILWPGGVCGLG